jgi:hypothetical protein
MLFAVCLMFLSVHMVGKIAFLSTAISVLKHRPVLKCVIDEIEHKDTYLVLLSN